MRGDRASGPPAARSADGPGRDRRTWAKDHLASWTAAGDDRSAAVPEVVPVPAPGDPGGYRTSQRLRELPQGLGIRVAIAGRAAEEAPLVEGDAPDEGEPRAGLREAGQPLDAHASLPERGFRSTRLAVDLSRGLVRVRQSPPPRDQIEVRVDDDEAIGAHLRMVRGDRRDSETGIRDADQHERAADPPMDCT